MRFSIVPSVARMERQRHPGSASPGFRHSASKDSRKRAYGLMRSTYAFQAGLTASITGRAMAQAVIGLPVRRRIDMEVDHADAALFEHVDTLGGRARGIRRAGHRADADGTLRLGELGNVGHRILHA